MTEETVDQHGDATLNAAGVCLPNPLAATLAFQQQMLRSTVEMQFAFAQAAALNFWRAVLK